MRLNEINISTNGVKELDIMELTPSCVVIISDGKVKFSELPEFAETEITTQQEKVTRV